MGRKPTNPDSVTRLRKRKQRSGTIYYYYDLGGTPRKEIALGSDYGMAIVEYAKLEKSRASSVLVHVLTNKKNPENPYRSRRKKTTSCDPIAAAV